MVIANEPGAAGIAYEHERPFIGKDGTRRYPDCTIEDADTGVTWSYGDSFSFPNFGSACVMARIARLVVPGIPLHVTQRGNRRERTVFGDSGYRLYRDWLGIAAAKAGAEIWLIALCRTMCTPS
jgi:hypothetical protein